MEQRLRLQRGPRGCGIRQWRMLASWAWSLSLWRRLGGLALPHSTCCTLLASEPSSATIALEGGLGTPSLSAGCRC
eukprot:10896901-Karenia_brevis.AAC.1